MKKLHRSTVGVLALVLAVGPVLVGPSATSAVETDHAALDSALSDRHVRQVAPGLDLVSYQRLEPHGWNTGQVLVADLDAPTLSMDVVNSGKVAGVATTADQIAGKGAVAAVNGDFFDINASGAPVGNDVSREHGVLNGTSRATPAFTLDDGVAAIQQLSTEASLAFDGQTYEVAGVNTPSLATDEIGLYNQLWGDYTLRRPLGGPDAMADDVAEVTVVDGTVTDVADSVDDSTDIPAGGQVLIGREDGATTLSALQPGDRVDLEVGPSSPADVAVSGNVQLVTDGDTNTFADKTDHARTAIGLSKDGSELYVATVDAARGDSHGQQLDETARLMKDLGAYNAVNVDGGGSSTMYARVAGTEAPQLVNRPADGSERPISNVLAFYSTAKRPALRGVDVHPALAPDLLGQYDQNVMPGLHRTLTATGLDANLAATSTRGHFSTRGQVRLTERDHDSAVVVGRRPGRARVTYHSGGRRDATTLAVTGPLDHLEPSRTTVDLGEAGSTADLALTAYDGDGNAVVVEPGDVRVDVGDGFAIEPAGPDGFTVSTTVDSGSTTATLRVGDASVEVALTAGTTTTTVADFSDASAWTYDQARASGSLAPAEGPEGQPALGMTFDFTTSSNTRGSYAVAPQDIALPGQPREVTMWVDGDANGEWPRLQVVSGDGVTFNLDGPLVDWDGWQQVSFPVPAGTVYPLTLQRVRVMETRSTASYTGDLTFSDVAVTLAPDVEQPTSQPVHDPAVVGDASSQPQQIAVISDAQFTADDPEGPIVRAARRTLREIVAAKPDLVVIDGDWVDRGEADDLALAKRVLDEEVPASLPYVYVPGNHEAMGSPVADFSTVFGPTRTGRTIDGTRIITLDSSAADLHAEGLDQLHFLRSELDAAADDRDVTGVVVFFHHPPDDFLPDKASQLGDRYEAAAFQREIAEFRSAAHKSAAVVNGHVGAFHTASAGGVTYVTNGNSGKTPASTPSDGGFTGWTMLGIDPHDGRLPRAPKPVVSRTRWLQVQTHLRVDVLQLTAPATLRRGASGELSATVVQDGDREIPVRWPVSATWGGGHVELAGKHRHGRPAVVRIDPEAGTVTGVRRGRAVVEVVVNGVEREAEVTVR